LRTALLQPIDMRHGGEMIDPKWESAHGHAVAAARYGVMSRFPTSQEPDHVPDNPRAAALYLYERKQDNAEQDPHPYLV
jgi:hypothetical protein